MIAGFIMTYIGVSKRTYAVVAAFTHRFTIRNMYCRPTGIRSFIRNKSRFSTGFVSREVYRYHWVSPINSLVIPRLFIRQHPWESPIDPHDWLQGEGQVLPRSSPVVQPVRSQRRWRCTAAVFHRAKLRFECLSVLKTISIIL